MAEVGCSTHVCEIYDRGGTTRVGSIDNLTEVSYSRVRDDMSMASAVVTSPSLDCSTLLQSLEPNRHELVIWRDGERVWEGPISRIEYQTDRVWIEARDVMYVLYRLIMKAPYPTVPWTAPNPRPLLVSRAMQILNAELARREAETPPINVKPHLLGYIAATNPVHTYRDTPAYASTVFEEIDSMAQHSGLDYTAIGRRIILSDVRAAWFTTPTVTEADFMGPVVVTAYGLEGATVAAVTDGEGAWGEATIDDDYYGHWEILETETAEEPTASDTSGLVVSTLATAGLDAFAQQAERNLVGRYPVPITAYLPQGSRLAPGGRLLMEHLIPGVRIPLRATLSSRTFNVMQKLDRVQVKEDVNGEVITVDLSAASLKDEAATVWTP